ncbi:dipeptidase [Salinicoccus sp. RF5]|uniref:dipeptidase n=1 Tax=Salinicoccus sp. RF5 TaxID=2748874 RepID=UPI001E2A2D08|nr:dipeptidase [Salinicoccus sp. RF5]MCC4721507.1 dipeptidase [Salinicoccus sp. RF5]
MEIIDTHCDALLKLQSDYRESYRSKERSLNFKDGENLDTSAEKLRKGGVKVQFFAIFIPPMLPDNEKWQHALEQVDCFYNEVLAEDGFVHIRNFEDIDRLEEGEIGAVLALEGVDAIGNDLMKLRTLFRLGVLSVGLTWNDGNLAADGVGEHRGTGLSKFGFDVVDCCNRHNVLVDVSHLNPEGVDDVIRSAERVIATHSNAREIFDHRRNLHDAQIKALINKGGMVNIVFNPPFIEEGTPGIEALFAHIDRIIELGGEQAIGLGSDFDGIASYVEGLEDAGKYQNLVEALVERYGEDFAERITHLNFMERYVKKDLS